LPRPFERHLPILGKSHYLRFDLCRVAANDRGTDHLLADRSVIAAYRSTVVAQHIELILKLRNGRGKVVPAVSVFCNDAQHFLLAARANPDRWVGLLHWLRRADRIYKREVLACEVRIVLHPVVIGGSFGVPGGQVAELD
jgi:hypothetical protein